MTNPQEALRKALKRAGATDSIYTYETNHDFPLEYHRNMVILLGKGEVTPEILEEIHNYLKVDLKNMIGVKPEPYMYKVQPYNKELNSLNKVWNRLYIQMVGYGVTGTYSFKTRIFREYEHHAHTCNLNWDSSDEVFTPFGVQLI